MPTAKQYRQAAMRLKALAKQESDELVRQALQDAASKYALLKDLEIVRALMDAPRSDLRQCLPHTTGE